MFYMQTIWVLTIQPQWHQNYWITKFLKVSLLSPLKKLYYFIIGGYKGGMINAIKTELRILSRHKKSASCSLPWEDQVEYDPKILPPPCFTIKVKIWSGEAAAQLLISTLMTTSAFLRFHFDLHGPAQSAVKLQFSWVKCLLVVVFWKRERKDLTELGLYH